MRWDAGPEPDETRDRRPRPPEYWYYRWHPTALALNGEHDAAIAMIERSIASGLGLGDWWHYFETEPAYAPLRRTVVQ